MTNFTSLGELDSCFLLLTYANVCAVVVVALFYSDKLRVRSGRRRRRQQTKTMTIHCTHTTGSTLVPIFIFSLELRASLDTGAQ
jgi:hypothetical protein